MNDAAALAMLNASESKLAAFSDDEWRNLILYLVDHLQSYFGGRIVTEPIENACVGSGSGFCIDLASAKESPNSPMNWKGIMGASVIDCRLHVSLTVFFYSCSQRLIISGGKDREYGPDGKDGKEFAEYVFVADQIDGCRWELLGWFDDVYGEYTNF